MHDRLGRLPTIIGCLCGRLAHTARHMAGAAIPLLRIAERYHNVLNADNAMRETHMNAEALTHAFSGAYGRLCYLVAGAITTGYDKRHVVEAARGKGNLRELHYIALRDQRARVNRTLEDCKSANVPSADLIAAGRMARAAVQQEFDCRIPVM